jgi:hypothetical protein
VISMPENEAILLKLSSVILTREKQIPLQEEFNRYGEATNWVIRQILKKHLTKQTQMIESLQDEFSEQFDGRLSYLNDVIRSATSEITRHRKLAVTVRSMRDKTPYFKKGRVIFSQPIVKVGEKALLLTLPNRERLPIPYDKFSRNKNAETLASILKGEIGKGDAGEAPKNKRYSRVRLTWNNEGFVNIDIRFNLPIKQGSEF